MSVSRADILLQRVRSGASIGRRQQLMLTVYLSVPAIVAQLSSIVMQYIDASMVGSLGAQPSASIGLMSTSIWLFSGLCSSVVTGFSVQVAHRIGASDFAGARSVLRKSLLSVFVFSAVLAGIGIGISGVLPTWLGGDPSIREDASSYFFIYAVFLPFVQMNFLFSSMLRCSGNMRIPSLFGIVLCILDVVFNFFLIFPVREMSLAGYSFMMPGAGLGVKGAALGTVLSHVVIAAVLCGYLCFKSEHLAVFREKGSYRPDTQVLKRALHICLPMGLEHFFICGAQIMTTVIVAPLGVFAIAANSFAITAESLCYMPGYGIAEAATTLVGQSLGAGRRDLTRSFAWITVLLGMGVMTVMGVLMYLFAPQIIGIMTPVQEIRDLGVMALRIEAFAEPMFAASIVAYSVFVGAADTVKPCCMNLISIWAVRLSLAAILAPQMGLKGVWLAMCIELCFRGLIFLIRLAGGKWLKNSI